MERLNYFSKLICNERLLLYERIPQAQHPGLFQGSGRICEAAIVCRGCPPTESEVREIYCTGDLSGEGLLQETLIELWAKERKIWYDFPEKYFATEDAYRDEGTESVVYIQPKASIVTKFISLKHYNIPRLAIDRIIIHNATFPDSLLKVIGFGRDYNGRFVIIAQQDFIVGDPISEDETLDFMTKMGFEEVGYDYGMHLNYRTDDIYIGDLNQFNVIKGQHGIHVIDADCRLNLTTLGCGGKYRIPSINVDFSQPCFLGR